MWRRKIALFVIVVLGVLPLSTSGSADFDNSLQVDFNDLFIWTNYWLYDYNDNRQCDSWDLAENGVIDLNDLAVIVNNWLIDYDFVAFADFAPYWRRTVDYRFNDARFDLSGDGFVNSRDYSAFAAEWMTVTNPCNDINVSGPWVYLNFTNIGPCGMYDCWFYGEDYSDPCNDNCGHKVYMGCVETPEFEYYCAYNYWFNSTRVGLCVYTCGINYFQYRKNASGKRILQTRHRTQDQLTYGCDEGTTGKYDWQIVIYSDVTHLKSAFCRESTSDPSVSEFWETYHGQSSACENRWWQ